MPMTENDTLSAWLYWRFGPRTRSWDTVGDEEKDYWEHQAAAVRRAVDRGGFRQRELLVTEPGRCIGCQGGCPVAPCHCGHLYHGHASDTGPRPCLNCACTKYRANQETP